VRAQTKYGTDYPHAKLNAEQVIAIRANRYGRTYKQMAETLGVTALTVAKVARYETYRNVRGDQCGA
jgi:predicted transcriptional regulator